MEPDSIHQPHDKLFKAAFSNPETAAAFLRSHLPSSLSNSIGWSSLEFLPGSFIDEQLRGSEADLLFRVKSKEDDLFLYVLWEHRSSPAPLMALRLLSYMVRIWTQQAQEQGAALQLSPILPVVLAQDQRSWKISERFGDLFGLSEERWAQVDAFTPDFAFRLLQLVDMPYEKIAGTPEGILTLRALKAEAVGELLHEVVWEPRLLRAVSLETAERFFRYMLNAGIDKQTFERRVQDINSVEILQRAMTLADQYRQEGLEQGETRAQRRMLLEVLTTRFDVVPQGLRENLEELTDREKLTALLKTALRCASLEDFVRSL
jgi:predicted transposase/invertase (TIGR01784 family)